MLHREEEKATWRRRQRLEWCNHKPRNARSYQRAEEARSRFSPRVSGGSRALLTPQFHLSKTSFHIMGSRIGREWISVILSPWIWDNFLHQSQKTNAKLDNDKSVNRVIKETHGRDLRPNPVERESWAGNVSLQPDSESPGSVCGTGWSSWGLETCFSVDNSSVPHTWCVFRLWWGFNE